MDHPAIQSDGALTQRRGGRRANHNPPNHIRCCMTIQPNDYAVVVGIDHYLSGELVPLSSAVRDAEEVQKWLVDQTTGGGLPQDHCELILSKANSGKPVHSEIDDAFEKILNLAKQNANSRRLYFYFSGHGMAASAQQAFLCLPRWSSQRRNAALDSEDYWQMLAETGRFQEIVCLFDCCRSYKPNVGGVRSELRMARPDNHASQTRLFLAFAAEFLKSAYLDSKEGGHSFFTQALLSGLRGGACLPTGGVPAERLKAFLESETKSIAELAGKPQRATVSNGFPSENEPVFGAALPLSVGDGKLHYAITLAGAPNRSVVLVRPDNTETRWDGSQPWRIEVEEGLHLLEDRTNGRMFRLPRDLTQGEIHVQF